MRRLSRTLAALTACSALAILGSASLAVAQEPVDARAIAPTPLLGVWKADIAASTYAGPAPREQFRIFQYTEDAKLLVVFLALNGQGQQSGGHWAVQLDGAPGVEYHSSHGPLAYNVVALKKVDERTFDLTVARGGEVNLTGRYELAEDGSTLTYSYGAAPRATRIVYRRWEAAN